MISKIISIAGKEYLAKYPIGALILAEKKLGWKLIDLNARKSDLSFEDMSILVRYGLHKLTGELITDTEYEEIINNVDMQEFMAIVPDVLSAFGGNSSASSSKN